PVHPANHSSQARVREPSSSSSSSSTPVRPYARMKGLKKLFKRFRLGAAPVEKNSSAAAPAGVRRPVPGAGGPTALRSSSDSLSQGFRPEEAPPSPEGSGKKRRAKKKTKGSGGGSKAKVAPALRRLLATSKPKASSPASLLQEHRDALRAGFVPPRLLRVGFEHLVGEMPAPAAAASEAPPSDAASPGPAPALLLPPSLASRKSLHAAARTARSGAGAGAEGAGGPASFRAVSANSTTAKATRTMLDIAAEAAATDETVRLAIDHLESGEVEKAFEQLILAAEKGSPLGLFLFGISLRHGWGCDPDPPRAINYLRRAAETSALELDQQLKQSKDAPGQNTFAVSAARSELVLSIYELGISFANGLGVEKDTRVAAYYFEIAATLGDADAQNDVARMYEHGIGVKKDM
ncbi:MAG: hypothetical protein BJ554DRAFT_3698, partial [Olpidium bornovanus]